MSIPQVPLNEAFWFQEGPGVRKWQFTTSGIKLLNVANIVKDGTIDLSRTDRHLSEEEVNKKYSHFLVDSGDLVIASSGITIDSDGFLRTRGGFIEERHLPLCMNTSTIRFKSLNGSSDLGYLRHWLQSFEFRSQITREVTGIAQKNFGPSHLKRLRISLPPLAEQKRIAAILDAADALRAKRREALAQLDTLLQSTFLDMFGDPVINPMGWEVRSLGDLAVKKPNNGVFRRNPEYSESLDSGLPVVWVVELFRGNRIDVSESRRLEATQTEIEKYGLLPGDLLFCRSSLKLDGIAYNNVFLGEREEALFECHLIRISPRTDVVNPMFLNFQLRSVPMRALLKLKSNTATMTTIGQKALSSVEVVVPPAGLQSRFAAVVESVEQQRPRQRAHLAELDTLLASLQTRAFRGDL